MRLAKHVIRPAALALFAVFALSACASGTSATVRRGGPSMAQAQAERYDGPKARLAVVKFVDKTAKGAGHIGAGLADMLTAELFRTNRFIMLDRSGLDEVISEQDFAASGRISEATAARIGEIEGADLLVFGAVTSFEPDHIGAGGLILGAVTLGASIAIASQNEDAPLGAVLYKESHVAIDIKIVDAATGRVVAVASVEGEYYDWGGGVIGGVGGGASRVPVMLGGFAGTAAEQAVRVCIERAVSDIIEKTPTAYYRVEDTLDMTPAGLIVQTRPAAFPGASPSGVKARHARVIENSEGYLKLLADLNVPEQSAPVFDWEKTRLVALFAGEKETKGWRVGVVKAVNRRDYLEVTAREAGPVDKQAAEEGPDWPFDVVSVVNPGKPIRVLWQD
ncbi:MAG: CsgG/HfaB family protein [Candidatus Nitrospinota bacterium M3_3B_026]